MERNDDVNYLNQEIESSTNLIDQKLINHSSPKQELVENLMAFTKDQMIEWRDAHQLSGMNAGNRKQELAEKLAEGILEKFQEESTYLSSEQYTALLNHDLSGQESMNFEELVEKEFFYPLIRFGWLFVFQENERYTLVMPEEIQEAFNKARSGEDYQKLIQRRQKQLNVLTALTHLYGVFQPNSLIEIWNTSYPKEEMDMVEAMNLFEAVNQLSPWVAFERPFVYHKKYLTSQTAEELFKEAQKHPAYLPTKEELRYYSAHFFDTRSSEYQQFKTFLQKHLSEQVLTIVEERFFLHAKLSTPAQHFMEVFKELDVVLDERIDEKEFAQHYKSAVHAARKWTLHGYTSKEINETNKETPRETKRETKKSTFPPAGSKKQAAQPAFRRKRRKTKKIVRKKR